ncbi:MAG: anaerobic sulfatase-maturation protein [Bacteroidales bacterium]
MPTIAPFSAPLYVMAKPIGARCNLACKYCYYLEKTNLYKEEEGDASHCVMTDDVLEKFIQQYISCQTQTQVLFTWHGGEALLRPLEFYQKASDLQKKYANGKTIENCIQTNGILINDDWCEFFKKNNYLVGVSIDGTKQIHDKYRTHKNGNPSFDKVLEGIQLLNKHNVEWNAMAVVNDYNVKYPLEFYHFFKSIKCRYIQFTPIVERLVAHSDGRHLASQKDSGDLPMADFSVTPEQWGTFLCKIFDEWVRNDVGDYYIQLFDATLANWLGQPSGVCSMNKTCGHAGVIEYNGDVYSCDHFVFPEYKLGNIYNQTLTAMMYSEKQILFGNAKYDSLPNQCKNCKFGFACNGECPKNRFVETDEADKKLNYLCKGYYTFFEHAAPYMEYMKNELIADRAPANIMTALQQKQL